MPPHPARYRRAAPAALVLLWLALAVPARAGTVTLEPFASCGPFGCISGGALRFVADAGERNDVTLDDGGTVLVDRGAPPVAGAGCTQVDLETVRCDGGTGAPDLALGDGDDRASTAAPRAILRGGPDADVLTGPDVRGDAGQDTLACAGGGCRVEGGAGADRLAGGPGPDRLTGGPGDDTLAAGGGDDSLSGDEGLDRLDGGDGRDTVTFGGAIAPVRVDLGRGTADGDAAIALEVAVGGDGDDVLIGGAGPDTLAGGAGRDVLLGAAGDDALDGGPGADSVDGGAGADTLRVTGPGPDRVAGGPGPDRVVLDRRFTDLARGAGARVACGGGADLVLGPDAADVLGASCEAAGLPADVVPGRPETVVVLARRLTRTPTGLALRVSCRACPAALPVHGVTVLDRRGVGIADGLLSAAAARRGLVRLPVPRGRRGRLPVAARIALQAGGLDPPRTVVSVRIDPLSRAAPAARPARP